MIDENMTKIRDEGMKIALKNLSGAVERASVSFHRFGDAVCKTRMNFKIPTLIIRSKLNK